MTKSKGIYNLISAFKLVHEAYPCSRLCILGQIPQSVYFQDHISPIKSFSYIPGFLSLEDVLLWYNAADIGVIPSYSEQCSFVALEMMRAELTIVTTDANGLKEIFTDSQNSYIAEISEKNQFEQSLSNAIKKALQIDVNTYNKFKKINNAILETRFSKDLMIEKYRNIIKVLTNNSFYS